METVYKNGLTWKFETLPDGWIAIYLERPDTLELIPRIQAIDREMAMAFVAARERFPFGVNLFKEKENGIQF